MLKTDYSRLHFTGKVQLNRFYLKELRATFLHKSSCYISDTGVAGDS